MIVVIKGAGDLATGIGHRLNRCGFKVIMTEIESPTMVRRTVSFSQAVYDGETVVEGVKAKLAKSKDDVVDIINNNEVAVIIDEKADIIKSIKADVVIDSILAKRNLGTSINDAKIVIGIGPGFTAKKDCHCVIETKRGHYLGKVILEGEAIKNTGIPGDIGGYTVERIIRATDDGRIKPVSNIGDYVKAGEVVALVNDTPIYATIDGIIRGMLQDGVIVSKGMKSGDIDPRCEKNHCFTISDKARSIGGGALEAILMFNNKRN